MDNGGYTNDPYISSIGPTPISVPGEYRSTLEYGAPRKSLSNGSHTNTGYESHIEEKTIASIEPPTAAASATTNTRDKWSSDIQFLFSCIALSVGLGNVWRFPFTALENGGGAFVIPYLIVLFVVGKPIYYMEMLLGQFSSRACARMFDFSPIMRGVGYGQVIATGIVTTYYATLMAITLRYFVDSFYPTLPWSYCRAEWGDKCIDSRLKFNETFEGVKTVKVTSAEFYFIKQILREKDSIDDGIGEPSWTLAISLAVSWLVIAMIMIKGIKSSGKASYFLALFPYVILLILLVRAMTLPGAFDGVLYFIKPQWDKLLDPNVWFAAVTQVFFSLSICFSAISMYSSYNRFDHNVYRDATIVTALDTFTSMLSGVVIFGILGNLAHETHSTDIQSVVKGGSGLAFISYPDAIAKFSFVPQIFSVLFFLMLFVLGIGSNVGMASCIMTAFKDKFVNTKHWVIVVGIAVVGYMIGLMYITPGGQYILNLLDFYGASFVVLVLAIFELVAVGWIYGVKRLCKDIEFMLGIKTSLYYRICWGIVTPCIMTAILIYMLVEYEPLKNNGYTYQNGVYVFGWCLSAFNIGQLVFWAIYTVRQQPTSFSLCDRILNSFKPDPDWGPADPKTLKEYKRFMDDSNVNAMFRRNGFWHKIYDNIFG